jgi:hypothetical protein
MPEVPTVFEQPRANALALPGFVCAVCLLTGASMLIRGFPADTSNRVVFGVVALGAIASAIWFLRWRGIAPARIAIEREVIVMYGFGGKGPLRKIVRRPGSRLRTRLVHDPSSVAAGYILFDEAVGQPHLPIDAFGVDRVIRACRDHGWELVES